MKIIVILLLCITLFSQGFTREKILIGQSEGFTEYTQARILYLPDGKHLLCGIDYSVKLIRIRDGKKLRTWYLDYPLWALAISPDGKTFATTCSSQSGNATAKIQIWDMESSKSIQRLEAVKGLGYISCLEYSPDGRYLAGAGDPATVLVWNVKTAVKKELSGATYGNIPSLDWSPDGTYLAAGNLHRELPVVTQLFPDAKAYIWTVNDENMTGLISLWPLPQKAGEGGVDTRDVPTENPGYFEWEVYTLIDYYSENYAPQSLKYSSKGRFLLAAGREVSAYNAQTGEKLLTYTSGESTHYLADWHPTRKNILISGMKAFEWRDGVKGTLLKSYPSINHPGFYPLSFTFSPDGATFVHAEYDRQTEKTLVYAVIEELPLE